ncbi:hypothetical protein [Cellulomonas sp. S1-8]|uniref:hypothetical protein n=1 Tax=Cellulomonas sp. S1-8 TaxID=2904790 RepID=UPI002242EF7B|nr:hypothetical protein [Cellulomonas sp. S1-8]UZN01639.1 hypothetical protein OKX07_11025 [Cellulomonas sp. S1-8]
MFDLTIAVPDGAYRIEESRLGAVLRAQWPRTVLVPATGRMATYNTGQWQVYQDVDAPVLALLRMHVAGDAVDIEVADERVAAQLVSMITSLPGFPSSGEVLLFEWAPSGPAALTAVMSPQDVLALR